MSVNKRLKICLVSAEFSSLAKTGGLADVTAALTRHFVDAGHDCRVLVPYCEPWVAADLETETVPVLEDMELLLGGRSFEFSIVRAQMANQGPAVYLLRCPELYADSDLYRGADEHLRFILLSRAAIEMCQRLKFAPDIFHCHDWHTALIPIYLKTCYVWDRLCAASRTVLTIHNIGFQGVFGAGILYETGLSSSPEMLDQGDLAADRINFLKTGIMYADLLTTVSPTYAREILEPEYGMGLETLLRERRGSLVGILNGVDYEEWSPDQDPLIDHSYSSRDMTGKEKNKQAVMEELGLRRAELENMVPDGKGRIRLEFIVPARGLIGFRSMFLTMTSGSGIMTHVFDHYGPVKNAEIIHRSNGVLVSMVKGKTLAYGLFNLQDRGRLFVDPNIEVYEGQIVGIHSRDNDLTVNPMKAKQLTNIRAAGSDRKLSLAPPVKMSLEELLEYIAHDECVEVTPRALRLRKLFEFVGDRVGLHLEVLITDGHQPIGRGIGPVLEARDVMQVLENDPDQPLPTAPCQIDT